MGNRYEELLKNKCIRQFWNSSDNNLLFCPPKGRIYHYTSSNAFASIIQNEKLWATKANYMNDMKEIDYACDLFYQRLNESKIINSEKEEIRKSFQDKISKGLFDNIFVLCFSSNPDSLPLWSYYGKSDGYNIGFDPSFISDLVNLKHFKVQNLTQGENNELYFAESTGGSCVEIEAERGSAYIPDIKSNYVLYSKEKQIEVFDLFLDEINFCINNDSRENRLNKGLCISKLVDFIPFMKHNSYSNEEEYRVLLQLKDASYIRVQQGKPNKFLFKIQKYRVFDGALIPYISLKLNESNYFRSITISPFNRNELSKKGLNEIVYSFPYDLEIIESEIPSRF